MMTLGSLSRRKESVAGAVTVHNCSRPAEPFTRHGAVDTLYEDTLYV